MKVRYLCIYTMDIDKGSWNNVKYFKPNSIKYPLWKMTEDEVEDPEYYKAHRKYVGELSAEQLKDFLTDINYIVSIENTMGSLTEYGLQPAVSFQTESTNCMYDNLYVTPLTDENFFPKEDPGILVMNRYWAQYEKQLMDVLRDYEEDNNEVIPSEFIFDFNQLEMELK